MELIERLNPGFPGASSDRTDAMDQVFVHTVENIILVVQPQKQQQLNDICVSTEVES